MVKKKHSWINKQVDDAFSYISESKNYIFGVIIAFVVFAIIGFILIPLNSDLSRVIDASLRALILKTEGLSGIPLILFIFKNNLQVALYGIFLGIFLGIYPAASVVANGSILGYVLAKVYSVSGVAQFWRILPHGIFELPAIFISIGLGIKLGMFIFAKKPMDEVKQRVVKSVKVLLFIVIPLLLVAAIIEGLLITLLA